MKTVLRVLLVALLLTVALGPLGLHFSVLGPLLAHAGHRGIAVMSLLGAVAWFMLCLRALPAPAVARAE